MGCDIHGGLEIKDLNGKWHKYSPIIQDLSDFNKTYTSELPLGRDYTLFSILEKDHPRNYDNMKGPYSYGNENKPYDSFNSFC